MSDLTDGEIATTYDSSASSVVVGGLPTAPPPTTAARSGGSTTVDLRSPNLRHILTRLVFDRERPGIDPGRMPAAVAGYRRRVDAVLDALISLGCRSAACVPDEGGSTGAAAGGRPRLPTVVDGPPSPTLPPGRAVRPPTRPIRSRFPVTPPWTTNPGPCPCACNSGGFCGGCGHAGCGGRRSR